MMDLGRQPASDYFPRPTDPEPDPVHPLAMIQCSQCHQDQLETDPTSPDEPRGVEPLALVARARDAVARIAAVEILPPDGSVPEHARPHGGSWIAAMSANGLREVDEGPADVVVDTFGMMHDSDQHLAMRLCTEELAAGGVVLVQFHTLASILRHGMWNALRNGHFAYYSTPVLVQMAREVGLGAIGAWEFDLYGGTVMLAFARNHEQSTEVDRLIAREMALGVLDPVIVSGLPGSAQSSALELRRHLGKLAPTVTRVAGYGAASRSITPACRGRCWTTRSDRYRRRLPAKDRSLPASCSDPHHLPGASISSRGLAACCVRTRHARRGQGRPPRRRTRWLSLGRAQPPPSRNPICQRRRTTSSRSSS